MTHTPLPWKHSRKSVYVSDMNHNCLVQMLRGPEENAGNAALIVKAVNNHERLLNALTLFLATDEAMEGILWGQEPDAALVKITIPLGQYREARKALSQAKSLDESQSEKHRDSPA